MIKKWNRNFCFISNIVHRTEKILRLTNLSNCDSSNHHVSVVVVNFILFWLLLSIAKRSTYSVMKFGSYLHLSCSNQVCMTCFRRIMVISFFVVTEVVAPVMLRGFWRCDLPSLDSIYVEQTIFWHGFIHFIRFGLMNSGSGIKATKNKMSIKIFKCCKHKTSDHSVPVQHKRPNAECQLLRLMSPKSRSRMSF